jgi:hypothetical protein
MPLVLPESYEAQQINREIEQQVDAQIEEAAHWNKELKRIDPGLSLVLGAQNAADTELKAGYWHLRKRVPGGVDAYIVLQGPQGQYREPGAWMLEMLQGADMWDDRVKQDRKRIQRHVAEAKTRARATEKEQALDEADLAMRAAKRLKDSMGFEKRSDLKASPETLAYRKKMAQGRTEPGEKL